MQRGSILKKRPCKICRRWFSPHPRLKERQKTCGDPHCQREWHRRQCARWNEENTDYFQANYLQKKLDKAAQSKEAPTSSRTKRRPRSALPRDFVQAVIGVEVLVIIEYLTRLLTRRVQERIRKQVTVTKEKMDLLVAAKL
jgi:hypothetical protein